jgi:hypothetical protein
MKGEVGKITKGKMIDVVYENCGGEIFDQVCNYNILCQFSIINLLIIL